MNTSVKTILAFLEGAQTIIALYESPDGPTSHRIAFSHLSEILNDPKLLRAQIDLKADNDGIILMGEPNGPTVVMSLRPT